MHNVDYYRLNGAWGAEKAYQKEFFGGRLLGAEIASPDYG